MMLALLLQAGSPLPPSVTLGEAAAMSPTSLAGRLMPDRKLGPIVDVIFNGQGALTPPSKSLNRLWLVEQMVPFDATLCRSHVFNIEMKSDPDAKPYVDAVPTHPVKIEEYDRLWVPPTGVATAATCAAAPAQESGFGTGGLSLQQAAALVAQARNAFALAPRPGKIAISCKGDKGACGSNPRKTLAAIDWGTLAFVEQVNSKGDGYYVGDRKPADAPWGPAHVQFTFPYAADGATWVVTVDRKPAIAAARMDAQWAIYE